MDLAVLLNESDHKRLAELADSAEGSNGDALKFGRLDLLLFFDEQEFEAWRAGTEILKAKKPVTREEAVRVLEMEKARVRCAATT